MRKDVYVDVDDFLLTEADMDRVHLAYIALGRNDKRCACGNHIEYPTDRRCPACQDVVDECQGTA